MRETSRWLSTVGRRLLNRNKHLRFDSVPRLRELGILSIVDSDGDVTVPAYWFEGVGLEGILPLERQAGVDMGRLRREHPRMRFIEQYPFWKASW